MNNGNFTVGYITPSPEEKEIGELSDQIKDWERERNQLDDKIDAAYWKIDSIKERENQK